MTPPPEPTDLVNDFIDNPLALRCFEVVELVTDHLDDALDARDREAIQRHLDGCSGCTVFFAQIRVTVQLAAAVGQHEPVELPGNLAELSMLVAQREGMPPNRSERR